MNELSKRETFLLTAGTLLAFIAGSSAAVMAFDSPLFSDKHKTEIILKL